MPFRSIGFLPLLMTLTLGSLFFLKFHRDSKLAEYSHRLEELIDESTFDAGTLWNERQRRYFDALLLLDEAREERLDLDKLLEHTVGNLNLPAVYRPVLAMTLLNNLEIADEFQLLTEANRDRIASGQHPKIGAGGYSGEYAVLDNTVPNSYSPELEMRYANLLLKPESVWRRFPDKIGDEALRIMSACRSASLMTETSYARALKAVQQGGQY